MCFKNIQKILFVFILLLTNSLHTLYADEIGKYAVLIFGGKTNEEVPVYRKFFQMYLNTKAKFLNLKCKPKMKGKEPWLNFINYF